MSYNNFQRSFVGGFRRGIISNDTPSVGIVITALIVSMITQLAFGGFLLRVLWHWFLVPTFAVSDLSFFPAVGIVMVVNHLTHYQYYKTEEKTAKDFNQLIHRLAARCIVTPLLSFGFSFILHILMRVK